MLICHALAVSDFQILKLLSFESRNDPKKKVVHETKFSLKNLQFNTCLVSTVGINVSFGLFTKISVLCFINTLLFNEKYQVHLHLYFTFMKEYHKIFCNCYACMFDNLLVVISNCSVFDFTFF